MAAYTLSHHDQNSLDRKLSSSSSAENVFPGRGGPLSTQRSVADSLQSYPGGDFVVGGTRGAFYGRRNPQSAPYFGAMSPPHRSSSCPSNQTTDYVSIEQPTTYYSPDSNYEQRQSKPKKNRAPWSSKPPLELSVINESVHKPTPRDSYVDMSDETPLFIGSIDKKKKKAKKETKRESAVVGAAAASGTAAVGVAAHSAGMMATSAAAGSCCCVGVCAKSVSVVMFVAVVATVGYAGFNGVATALHQSVTTTVLTTVTTLAPTVGLKMTTFEPTTEVTDVSPTHGCPLLVKPTLQSLLHDSIDDGRCNSTVQGGFYASESSCKEFYLCENNQLTGVGECPCDEYFSPNSLSCEYQNGGYYRDALNCNEYHRCDDNVGEVRRADRMCNTMEYYNVRNPVAPTCAWIADVTDCPWDVMITTTAHESTSS